MVMDVGVQAWEPRGVPVGHMTEDSVNPSNLTSEEHRGSKKRDRVYFDPILTTRLSLVSQTREVVGDYAMPCEAKTEDKGHRRRYLGYVYESSNWGLPVAQKLGP